MLSVLGIGTFYVFYRNRTYDSAFKSEEIGYMMINLRKIKQLDYKDNNKMLQKEKGGILPLL